jgi:hypothetical protein
MSSEVTGLLSYRRPDLIFPNIRFGGSLVGTMPPGNLLGSAAGAAAGAAAGSAVLPPRR